MHRHPLIPIFSLFLSVCSSNAALLYVDGSASGQNTGESWANAYATLQDALFLAQPGDEIWVAQGSYTPDDGGVETAGNRHATFVLRRGVRILGGFSGEETSAMERDPRHRPSILSGNLGGGVHAYHVVTGDDADNSAVLDGFTVSGGVADGSVPDDAGAGIFIKAGSPVIVGCFIRDNVAANGAGCYNDGASPTFINCVFTRNSAPQGAAIFNTFGSAPQLLNCTVADNIAGDNGAAVVNLLSSAPTFTNTIVWGNTPRGIPPFQNIASTPTVRYSDIEGAFDGVGTWNADLGVDGGGNIALDPNFVNAATGDLRLCDSPAIDAGDNSAVPGDIGSDILMEPRFTDVAGVTNTGFGPAETVDMGAFEAPSSGIHVIRVDAAAVDGAGTGLNWQDAVVDLQLAMSAANDCQAEFWVAAGVYAPAAAGSGDRAASFVLRDNWRLYGGFAGMEANREERVPGTHMTVLSGDIERDDPTTGSISDNSFHVVFAENVAAGTVVDGFTLEGGHANGPQELEQNQGGGILLFDADITIERCVIRHNTAVAGGGIAANFSAAHIVRSKITGNSATNGGGISSSFSDLRVISALINANSADAAGGAFHNVVSSPTLANCTVFGNGATDGSGGAIFNDAASSPVVVNSILWANTATISGAEVYNNDNGSQPTFNYSIIANGFDAAGTWRAQLGVDQGNNVTADPLFVDPIGADGLSGTPDDDLRLQNGSPAIDSGNNAADTSPEAGLQPLPSTDLAGNPRLSDGLSPPGSGSGDLPRVDIGAYEFTRITSETRVVGPGAVIGSDGSIDGTNISGHPLQGTGILILENDAEVAISGQGSVAGAPSIEVRSGAQAVLTSDVGDPSAFEIDVLTIRPNATLELTGGFSFTIGALYMERGSVLKLPFAETRVSGQTTLSGQSGDGNRAVIRATADTFSITFDGPLQGEWVRFDGIGAGAVSINSTASLDNVTFTGGTTSSAYVVYSHPDAVVWDALAFDVGDGTKKTIQTLDGSGFVFVNQFLDEAGTWIGGDDSEIEDGGTIAWISVAPAFVYDVDGNGSVNALSDGLMAIRYLAGFRGETLIGHAVAADCGRCRAVEIEDFLAQGAAEGALDIDADGVSDALSDGLLLIRFLAGFRDGLVIDGATSVDCTRCSWIALEPFIQGRLP